MRNLRRALSLALASVMILGLMIVGSNALTADFGDADQIDEQYTEAIDVLTTVGLIDGMNDEANSFNPIGTLTRAQAAKLLSVMLLGEENADKLGTNNQIFQDVPKGNWAAGYISYCNSVGILAGNGDGTFNPEGKLTGVQFGKMLLVALGYKADIEKYVNDPAWETNVATDMLEAGIDVDNISFSDPITREQAAQMVFNTICAPMVEYVSDTRWQYVNRDLAEATNISDRTLSNTGNSNDNAGYTIEFGEKYIQNLEKELATDEFGRPSYTWIYDKKEINTYIDYDKMIAEYTIAVDGKDLYDALGKATVSDNDVEYYVDGLFVDNVITQENMVRNNTDDYDTTENGVLTEVFWDKDDKVITIVSINTFLAEVAQNYDQNKATLTLKKLYAPSSYANNFNTEISSDDVENLESYKKDDIISVNVAKVGSKYEVINVLDYELLSSVDLNKYSYQSYVVSNDNTVYYAATGMKTNNSGAMDAITDYSTTSSALDNTYNLYIDQYGFLIGNKVVDEKDNYLFLTGYDLIGSNLANKTATANVIFLEDGSMKTIDVNVSDTNKNIHNFKGTDKPADFYAELSGENTTHGAQGDSEYNKWFTYTEDDGVYTLSPVSRWIDVPYYGYNGFDDNNNPIPVPAKINCYDFRASIKNPGYSSVGGEIGNNKTVAVWGNDKSKFITVDAEDVSETTTRGISKIVNIYSGLDDVNITLDSGLYCDGIGYNDLYGKVLEPGKENVPSDYISSSKVVKSASSPAKYIDNPSMFVLYDKDNYVIGAIILGSDIGSKDNYGYILERVGSEYKENDKTYWQFNAVVNGEIKTLTAKTNASGVITGNSHFNDALIFDHTPTGTSGFVKFTYDNDGYVIGVTHVSKEANTSKLYDNGDYRSVVDPDVYSLYDLEWKLSTDPNQELRDGSAFTIKGRTLWGGINDAGIRHNADAPVVLLYQQEYTGTSGARTVHKVFDSLEDAKDFMVTNKMLVNNVFNGYVSAVLADNGYAEWIVIKCLDPYVITNDNGQGSGSAKTYVNKIGRDKSNNTFNITVRTNNSKLVNAITNNNTQAEVRITNLNGSQVTYEPSYPITKGAPVLVKGTNDLYEFIVSVPFKSDTEVTDELQISVAITDTTNNEAYLVEGGQFVPG